MHIIVCMKQVIDPEAPVSSFKIDEAAKKALPPKGTPPVLNPADENALEAALKIKDAMPDTKITVVSLGSQMARPVVKKALAAGADELFLLEDATFEDLDSASTARILATAIKKIGAFDLVLCGRQASDTDAAQVGSGVAELLELPGVTVARKVTVADSKLTVERVVADGYEVIESSLPALVTVSNEIGNLRFPTVKQTMAAQKINPTVWSAADLGVDAAGLRKINKVKLYQPVREVNTEIIAGETPEEAGAKLADRLREAKVI
ncbi:MAG: electron transfer flavoprotein subunit beta/FixA family protein [Dehalococcoidia bacterium]|nr:MAG: electron transfer flavoprotein subunit beta/FixA family protein [Dehalococcoidia bacterium]